MANTLEQHKKVLLVYKDVLLFLLSELSNMSDAQTETKTIVQRLQDSYKVLSDAIESKNKALQDALANSGTVSSELEAAVKAFDDLAAQNGAVVHAATVAAQS